MNEAKFLLDVNDYITKLRRHYEKNAITCDNVFDNTDSYTLETKLLNKIRADEFNSTTEKGDALEGLVKLLFKRIELVHSIEVTNRGIALGQIDIQLVPIDDDSLFEVWGLIKERPEGIIGECKNYSKKEKSVSKEEIEKTCWRTCKGGCLSFFVGYGYTQDATNEISFFNSQKKLLFQKHQGALIVPLTVRMLELVIENRINFCYFMRWAILTSKMMNISNYL